MTEEEKNDEEFTNILASESIKGINKAAIKSSERSERWERIFVAEKSKWPHGMGSKLRKDIPKEFHKILDECIEKSHNIARDACQSSKLTEAYFKDFKNPQRKQLEEIYIKEMTKLQNHWKNSIDSDWNFIKEWSDEELEKEIKSTIGQIKFEKSLSFLKNILILFVILGVIGLLVFGVKQLFSFLF